MTNLLTAAALATTLTIAGRVIIPPFSTTFITEKVTDGMVVATPIHTPHLELRPENSVAKAIGAGEALRCKVEAGTHQTTIDGLPGDIHTILLDCDGARFSVTGIEFERSE